MEQKYIRNFAIIAHIDHGKSTLADRLLELTGTVQKRDMMEQTLDSNPISRERGITIKLAPVTMKFTVDGIQYTVNLIDTPGHVDFSYEVERSLAACEGAILLVDATQGIQAQTLSNFHKAVRLGLRIIPVINKIDSPIANVAQSEADLQELLSANGQMDEIFKISAKTGAGVEQLLEQVVKTIPPPHGAEKSATRALVFSSQYDPKRGVVAFVRVVDGELKNLGKAYFLATKKEGAILDIGHFTPEMKSGESLLTGEVGFVATNIKDPAVVKTGDTLTLADTGQQLTVSALPGYQEAKPVVFVSFFPVDQDDFPLLEDGLRKLKLNDAAITFNQIASKALGRGFRCGFLGHLHAEVSQERLFDEFGLNIMATTPTVEFKIVKMGPVDKYEEPWVRATIIVPNDYVGGVITLCEDRRSTLIDMNYHGTNVTLIYDMPLAEIITDFFDQLKSRSSGFASMDYELTNYRPFDAVQLDILINHEVIDAFSQIFPREKADAYGKFLVEKLKEAIPRQQIPVPIQASVNGQVIARADIQAFRKDVGAKLYGGDFTRRLKLEQKQKRGKEKMKAIGKVNIPGDTFLKIFRT